MCIFTEIEIKLENYYVLHNSRSDYEFGNIINMSIRYFEEVLLGRNNCRNTSSVLPSVLNIQQKKKI